MNKNELKMVVLIIALFLTGCFSQDSEDKMQNISCFIKCECDTSLQLNMFDTIQVQTHSAIIPARWIYSTRSSDIIDSMDHFHGNDNDTGSYKENWRFLTKSSGSEIIKYEFKSTVDSTVYNTFEIAIDVK